MARAQIDGLVNGIWTTYQELAATVADLSNEQLDTQVTTFGGRQTTLRNALYQAIYQPLEHTIHVTKILQVTGAPGGHPTEAQLMLSKAAEALGMFTGLFARIRDEDLDNSFEEQTPKGVAEHVRRSVENARERARGVLEGNS